MLERVLQPLSDASRFEAPPADTGLRDLRDRLMRLLRDLGEFIARGGPLS